MKKRLSIVIALLMLVFLISCNPINPKYEKPFVLVKKMTPFLNNDDVMMQQFRFQDANGNLILTYDKPDTYFLGDSIK